MTAAPAPAQPSALPSRPRAWLLAARPATLTAAVTPVVVGTALALRDDAFAALPALAALLGAFALQVMVNFANDLSDFRRGADNAARLGPTRVTAAGLLTEREVTRGISAAIAVAVGAGLYLAWVGGWPVIAVGITAILAALAYTGGPWPYGYRGLGEVFVFIFFGVVAVVFTYYVQALAFPAHVLAASVAPGLTVTAILVVNNVRDIETDRAAGKRTLAVYLGRRLARGQFVATLAGAYLAAAALWALDPFSPWVLLSWLTLPLAIAPLRAVLTSVEGPPLNAALKATARLHFLFGLLLAIGLLL